MKKNLFLLVAICVLIGMSGCASNPTIESIELPQEQIVEDAGDDHAEIIPYLGIWFNEDHTSQLIITEAYFYYHDFSIDREVYAEIKAADLVENTLELRMNSILHGGQGMGFDSPMVIVKYQVVDQTMQITLGRIAISGGDQPVTYLYDEVLNH